MERSHQEWSTPSWRDSLEAVRQELMEELLWTRHALRRARQRGIHADQVWEAITRGEVKESRGKVVFSWRGGRLSLVVVASFDGVVVTTYRAEC